MTLKAKVGVAVGCLFLVLLVGFKGGLIPSPSFMSRTHLQQSDTRVMRVLFGRPLPESFKLTDVHYPGYSLVFNGPDGPMWAFYAAKVNAEDWERLSEEKVKPGLEPPEKGRWPSTSQRMFREFHNPLADEYYKGDPTRRWWPEEEIISVEGENAIVTVDSSSSPELTLYIMTRVPYLDNLAKLDPGSKAGA